MYVFAYIMRPYSRQVRLSHLLSLHSHTHTTIQPPNTTTLTHSHSHLLSSTPYHRHHTTNHTFTPSKNALPSTQRHRATPLCSSIRGIHWRWPRRSWQLPEIQGRRAHHRCICHWTSIAHLSVTPKQHEENRGRWPWWSWKHGHRD